MNYVEHVFYAGESIEEAVKVLQDFNLKDQKVFAMFNGIKLYSDTVTLDSAYKEITGLTKTEFEAKQIQRHKEYEDRKKEHKVKIPELTKEWIAKGHEILDPKFWEEWDKCVPIRLDDLYEGMELKCVLDLIKMLKDEKSFEEVKQSFYDQGHSGMSASLVENMLIHFHDKGKEFVYYVENRK